MPVPCLAWSLERCRHLSIATWSSKVKHMQLINTHSCIYIYIWILSNSYMKKCVHIRIPFPFTVWAVAGLFSNEWSMGLPRKLPAHTHSINKLRCIYIYICTHISLCRIHAWNTNIHISRPWEPWLVHIAWPVDQCLPYSEATNWACCLDARARPGLSRHSYWCKLNNCVASTLIDINI